MSTFCIDVDNSRAYRFKEPERETQAAESAPHLVVVTSADDLTAHLTDEEIEYINEANKLGLKAVSAAAVFEALESKGRMRSFSPKIL